MAEIKRTRRNTLERRCLGKAFKRLFVRAPPKASSRCWKRSSASNLRQTRRIVYIQFGIRETTDTIVRGFFLPL